MDVETIGKPLEIAKEKQIILNVDGNSYKLSCTPLNLEHLVLGFLFTQRIVSNVNELKRIEINEEIIKVKVNKNPRLNKREIDLRKIYAKERFEIEELRKSLSYLDIEEYKKTRGYHVACIVGKKGLIKRAYDVGRYNAVDKVIGMCFKENIDFSKVFLLISGRISREMVLKCVNAKIPLIVSKAAIFDSAIDLCMKTGLSAVSFATNLVVKGEAIK